MKFVIDMMGGDHGVETTIGAVKEFLKLHDDVYFYCVGNVECLSPLEGLDRVTIVPSTEVLKMDVDPMEAMHKKDSSLNIAMETYLKENCDCLVSAGSTGALVSEGVFKIKRMAGIKRPCLVSPFPTVIKGKNFVCADLGANTENTSENLLQFAKITSIFYRIAYNCENPKVYLLNNGTEEEKGNNLMKETYQLLKNDPSINFKGNMEAREPLNGECDVLITDGFTGNIFLKSTEGACKVMSNLIKRSFKTNFMTKIGYLFAKKGFKDMSETMDYKSTGGAMLLGVNGLLIKAHGSSDVRTFVSSLKIGYRLSKNDIINKIKGNL